MNSQVTPTAFNLLRDQLRDMFDDSFDQLWADYYAAKLSPREIDQFRRACRRPSSDLLNHIIKPMAFEPDKGTYLCVALTMNVDGRSYFPTKSLVADGSELAWSTHQFFTNGLRMAQHGDPDFATPSDRVVMTPFHVFTFEYDSKSLPFFQQQLGWFRSSKNVLDAPIGRFLTDLRQQFKDCVGINVTYSGNKSFHYHIVFSTHLIAGSVATPTSARYGFEQAWHRLKDLMVASQHLSIPADIQPDPACRFPEWFRRLPMGVREITPPVDGKTKLPKEGWSQFFGVPNGEIVPQAVMWESISLGRSARGGEQASLFEPSNFTLATVPLHKRKVTRAPAEFAPGSLVEQFCAEKLKAIFPGFRDDGTQVWPRFEGFRVERGENRAYFANSPSDRNPGSYMSDGFATVMIQGDNPYGLSNSGPNAMPRLPRPLGQMLTRWAAEYEAIHAPPKAPEAVPVELDRPRTVLEQQFADAATDYETATTAIATVLDDLVLTNPGTPETHFLSAPEGISKTRSLIASTPRYHYSISGQQRPSLIMYAFATYGMAQEKADEFNAVHDTGALRFNRRYIGVVLPSFSHLYAEACDALKVAEISVSDAASYGYGSLWAAIETLQPEVMDYFRAFYRRMWKRIGTKVPVIFAVHQVAHGWIKNTPTRLMFCPEFWNGADDRLPEDKHARMGRCRKFTKLGLLIHDEVSAENLLLAVPFPLIEWVAQMRNAVPSAWTKDSPLAERFDAFERFSKSTPPPVECTYELASEIADVAEWETVTTRYSGEYGEREPRTDAKTGGVYPDIYAATAGKVWGIHVRPWPTQTAFKTIVLTTEAAPAHIVRRIASGWTMTELDTPLIARDTVETYPSKEVTSDNLGTMVQEWQQAFQQEHGRPLLAISNKAKHVTNTRTHAGAKGSNGYMGQDVIQTMVMMPPAQFEYFEALNAWTGRTDMVRSRHMDEFQQTCGRNLGFRKRGTPKHILLINAKLSECLEGEPKARARYVMQDVVTRRRAKAAKAQASSADAYKVTTNSKAKLVAIRAALLNQ